MFHVQQRMTHSSCFCNCTAYLVRRKRHLFPPAESLTLVYLMHSITAYLLEFEQQLLAVKGGEVWAPAGASRPVKWTSREPERARTRSLSHSLAQALLQPRCFTSRACFFHGWRSWKFLPPKKSYKSTKAEQYPQVFLVCLTVFSPSTNSEIRK